MSGDTAAQFDRVAANYATSTIHALGPDLQWLVQWLSPRADWRVLDMGTGAGHAAVAVAPLVARVEAIDLSATMLATAAQVAATRGVRNVAFTQTDASALPWPNATFDAAVTRYSAHHWPSLPRVLSEAARVLRPGATLVVIDTVAPAIDAYDTFVTTLELLRDPSHVRNRSLAEWSTCLETAGFALQRSHTWMLELDRDRWLQRAATAPWRGAACTSLLQEAPPDIVQALRIHGDGAVFHLPVALLCARRGA